ncbi:MAG: release factor glutamine methyltransferase, partial [Gaiellaceae bacterium]|nr:release factor glutamine methyltransferase [Gaiellaceae bacterium]
ERCLELIRDLPEPRVLDVGVGSGAIALAIADEHPGARVTGVDTSPAALELARENAARLGLPVELREGGVETAAEGWELVVSNPPYVLAEELARLEPEVRHWEPRAALLDAGQTEALVDAARRGLAGGGWLVLETHEHRAHEVAGFLREATFVSVSISRDLAGRERMVEGRIG